MQFTVTSTVKQVMGQTDGTACLLISNQSGFDFFLCNLYTDAPELDGFPVPAGTTLQPFYWTGPLWIGTNQKQSNGQTVSLVIVKSLQEKIPSQ
jgi:hypothetical protein